MLYEIPTYTFKPLRGADWLALYKSEGLPLQREFLGELIGFFTTEIGDTSEIVHREPRRPPPAARQNGCRQPLAGVRVQGEGTGYPRRHGDPHHAADGILAAAVMQALKVHLKTRVQLHKQRAISSHSAGRVRRCR
jgi:hypothetical protein